MLTSRQLVEQYFEYSNQSDMERITSLFHEASSYYSSQLGFFIGRTEIIEMQRQFHQQYRSLFWEINSLHQVKPNITEVQFSFQGHLTDGRQQQRHGHEHILDYQGLIQHIAVGI